MALIDKSVILNSNPTKKLRIAFDELKNNYTDESAKAYAESYKDKSLSFILENSRYIFSEPMYGYNFYIESAINNPHAFMFTEYENERDKICTFIDENGKDMSTKQKDMYDNLLKLMNEKCSETKNTAIIIEHGLRDDESRNLYNTIVESVYNIKNNSDEIENICMLIESFDNPDLFYGLAPYISQLDNGGTISNYTIGSTMTDKYFKECSIIDHHIDPLEWKNFIEGVVIVSKLYKDDIYKEAVSTLSWNNKLIFEGLAKESVKDQMNELFIERVVENVNPYSFNERTFNAYYSTPNNAVNKVFDIDDEFFIMKEDNNQFKTERAELGEIVANTVLEYVVHEYNMCDDTTNTITGYNFFNESTSIDDALQEISSNEYVTMETSTSKVVSKLATDLREQPKKDMEESNRGISPKKAKAPEAKNLASKIQNKAMDREAKFLKKQANREQKGQEIKNAVKAINAIPNSITDSIKRSMNEWDEANIEKRKEYMTRPGYRKKYLRNFKLALMYGVTARIKVAFIPVLFIYRHFSKQKDKRIRNELAREIDTEIKICEEKIADASADGNQQQKYELMRIHSKLKQEAARVKTNSKLI